MLHRRMLIEYYNKTQNGSDFNAKGHVHQPVNFVSMKHFVLRLQ